MSRAPGILALGGAAILAGCIPKLSFDLEGTDGGEPPGDGAVRDGARPDDAAIVRDGELPPECMVPVECASCPLPWLLVAIEDFEGDPECGGMVLRYSLTGITDACACPPLTGGGHIPTIVRRIGVYPPDTVVVANEEEVVAVDGRTDEMLWRELELSTSNLPTDVFAIQTPTGEPRIAVAWSPGTSSINSITVYDADNGGEPEVWRLNAGTIPLSFPISITQSPFNPTRFLALRDDMYASAEVDPWELTRSDPPHVTRRDGTNLHTIHALRHGSFFHTVWTGVQEGTEGGFNHWSGDTAFDQRVPLVDDCDEDYACHFLYAVADPAVQTGMIGLCEEPTAGRRVVRFRTTASGCISLIAQGEDLPAGIRLSSLAIAAPSFW